MDFFAQHGDLAAFGFIIAMFFFPRLTQIFATAHSAIFSYVFGPAGVPVWWAAMLILPRCTAALTATFMYSDTNPFLVFLAWIWAVSFDIGEKVYSYRKMIKSEAWQKIKDM